LSAFFLGRAWQKGDALQRLEKLQLQHRHNERVVWLHLLRRCDCRAQLLGCVNLRDRPMPVLTSARMFCIAAAAIAAAQLLVSAQR
jgi:hypothetical protein